MSAVISCGPNALGLIDKVELWDGELPNRSGVDEYHIQSAWCDDGDKRQEPKDLNLALNSESGCHYGALTK
jgi:hypothetical protein